MYRITGRNNKYHAKFIEDPMYDISNLVAFIEGCNVVIYVDNLADLEDIGIDPDNIETVE